MNQAPRRLRRSLRGLAYGLLAVVGLPCLALVLILCTQPGRDWLGQAVCTQFNRQFSGTLSIDQVERVGPFGLTLNGVGLQAPDHGPALALDRFHAVVDWSHIAAGWLHLTRVELQRPMVDLVGTGAANSGLLAALQPTEPSPPEEPPSTPSEPAPVQVAIDAVRVIDGTVRLSGGPDLGVVTVQNLQLSGSAQLPDALKVRLDEVSAVLERNNAPLSERLALSGTYNAAGASQLSLFVRAGQATLKTKATLPKPPVDPLTTPLDLTLQVTGVGPDLFTRLGQSPVLPKDLPPVGLSLEIHGTAQAGHTQVTLVAGATRLHSELSSEDGQLQLRNHWHLEPPASWLPAGLPNEPLELRPRLRAPLPDFDDLDQPLPIALDMPRANWGQYQVPALHAKTRVSPNALGQLALTLNSELLQASVSGQVNFDGAAKLQASLQLPDLAALPLPEQVQGRAQLSANVHLSHDANLRAELTLKGEQIRAAGQHLAQLHLTASAKGKLSPEGSDLRLAAEANGVLNECPLHLVLQEGRATPTGLTLKYAQLQALGQQLQLTDLALRQGQKLRGQLQARAVNLQRVSEELGLAPSLAGLVSLDAQVGGTTTSPKVALHLQGRDLRVDQSAPLDLTLAGELLPLARHRQRLSLDALLTHGPKQVLKVNLTGRVTRLRVEHGQYTGHVSATVDSQLVQTFLPEQRLPGEGQVAFHLKLDPGAAQLAGQATVQPTGLADPLKLVLQANQTLDGGDLQLDLPGLPSEPGDGAQAHSPPDQLTAHWHHKRPRRPTWFGLLDRLQEGLAVEASVHLNPLQLGRFAPLLELPAPLDQLRVSLAAQATYDTHAAPSLDLTLLTRIPPPPPVANKPTGSTTDEAPAATQTALAKAVPERCSNQAVAGQWHIRWDGDQVDLNGALSTGQHQAGTVQVSGQLPWPLQARPFTDLRYAVDLARLALRDIPQICEHVAGNIHLQSRGQGLLGASPTVTLSLQTSGLHNLYYRHGTDLSLWGEATAKHLRINGQVLHDDQLSPFGLEVPITFGHGHMQIRREAPLQAQLHLAGLRPQLGPAGPLSQVSGRVWADLNLSGTVGAPHASGRIFLDNLAFTASALSQPLHGIRGEILLDGDQLNIPKLTIRDLDGRLDLSGQAHLPSPDHAQTTLRLDVQAKDFPLRSEGQVAAEANLNAHLDAQLGSPQSTAQLAFDNLDLWLFDQGTRQGISLQPHPDIVNPNTPTHVAPPPQKGAEAETFELAIRAQDSFWVKRKDFAVNLAADLNATVDAQGARMRGDVQIRRGYVQLIGQTFDLEPNGKIHFLDGYPINPVLDMSATATGRSGSQSATITVLIQGRALAPELQFLIDDEEATAGDVMLALFGGNRSSTEDSASLNSQAGRFVTGMLAGMLAVTARRELGAAAPILMIDQNSSGDTQLRAGFDLDSLVPDFLRPLVLGLYLEGIVGENGQNQSVDTGVLLELYFPHQLIGSGQYGPGNTWALDLAWDP